MTEETSLPVVTHHINQQQKLIRSQIRAKRKMLTPEQQTLAAQKVTHKILAHPAIQTAQHIAIFQSFDAELSTRPIIEALWQQQKSVYLPVIHPFNKGYLLFLHYNPGTSMIRNTFGIEEPKLDVRQVIPFNQLDVVITPLVAFDHKGYRIGMGGGYYDRMLSLNPRVTTIGIAHTCQQVEEIIPQPWDIPLSEIITD